MFAWFQFPLVAQPSQAKTAVEWTHHFLFSAVPYRIMHAMLSILL